jgi:protein-disulfide isomerase
MPSIPEKIENWEEYVRGHNPALGGTTTKIVIVEFTDFQCPYCNKFNENTRNQLLSKYGEQIRLVFKHYPLEVIHTEAKKAAVAAQCAFREDKFWEINDIFFKNQDKLSTEFLIEAGRSIGLGRQYADCVTNQETLAEVEQDIGDGIRVGVQGTPAFLVNGKLVMGAIPLAQFETIIGGLD